ncbi:hypothetical protein B7463_g9548, partial [Scytalidium lignicola]
MAQFTPKSSPNISVEAAMEEGTLENLNNQSPSNSLETHSVRTLEGIARNLELDADYWVFRRFGRLHLLNLLYLQQDLVILEQKLYNHILKDETEDPDNLLPEIQRALSKYDAALAAQAQFNLYRKPESRTIRQMREWASTQKMKQNIRPLLRWLNISGQGSPNLRDLASIATNDKTWGHRFVDSHSHLQNMFAEEIPESRLPPKLLPSAAAMTTIYSEDKVRRAEAVFLHLSFCTFLMLPVVLLSYLESKTWKLVVLAITLFTASVLCVGSLNTPNKSSLALVAGYAAILVVFLSGNVGS